MKPIDKDALVAEIERLKDEYLRHSRNKFCVEWSCGTLDNILSFIDTLEVKDVDLEKEIMKYQREIYDRDTTVRDVAKHFFELGLSVRNGTKVTTPDIDDVLKENGVNPYSKEAKIIKESYFMAIEKLTQKGEEHEV